MGSESIIAELEKATEGLLFQSESDYPFKPFLWKGAAQEPLTPQTFSANRPSRQFECRDYYSR